MASTSLTLTRDAEAVYIFTPDLSLRIQVIFQKIVAGTPGAEQVTKFKNMEAIRMQGPQGINRDQRTTVELPGF